MVEDPEARADPKPTRTLGIRVHELMVGTLAAAGYLGGWELPVWVALGLSLVALVSPRFIVIARLHDLLHLPKEEDHASASFYLHRPEEMVRAALLGAGGILLLEDMSVGWLPTLAAASSGILEGTTGFSLTTVLYAELKLLVGRAAPVPDGSATPQWNTGCSVCRALNAALYPRCRWCHMSGVRWCCGLQTSLLLVFLMVVTFLLNARLTPFVVKVLITTSMVAVVALGLAINRQTDDLVRALDELALERGRETKRCEFLRRLSLTDSVEAAAQRTIEHGREMIGVRRMSVMIVERGVLRIVASLGIPQAVAERVAVPVTQRICGRVFGTRRAVIFHDVMAEAPDFAIGLEGAGASASLPLISSPMGVGGENVGCINVTDKPGGEFTAADIAELGFVAEAAAISLKGHLTRRELEQANYDTIRALVMTVEAKDPYVHGHSMRVQTWATAIGRELGLDESRLQMLACAAELHDIGKLAVPDQVLSAARPLTGSEWTLVRQHPFRGIRMIEHIGFLKPALPAILHHHERIDGQGYPHGLTGDRIPLEARILAVVDSYDAMTSNRPYRKPLTHEEAAAELCRCVGTQFDGRCVETFLRILGDEGAALAAATAAERPALSER